MERQSSLAGEAQTIQQMAETQSSKILPDRLGIFSHCKCTIDLEIYSNNTEILVSAEHLKNWTMGTTRSE